MIDPLRSLDRWASHSIDRSMLLMWLLVAALGAFVALAIAGEFWYTQPPPPSHLSQTGRVDAPG